MKRFLIGFILLLSFTIVPAYAQDDDAEPSVLVYGDTITGEITQREFEVIYLFEAGEDDIVSIGMIATNSSFDPYLYLTTLNNDVVAQNDDYVDTNSRIVARIPRAGTYQIVATRLNGRAGNGGGIFELSLDQVRAATSGVTLEGQVAYGDTPTVHVFVADEPGAYTFIYKHVRGSYFPGLVISKISEDNTYHEDIGQLMGRGLTGGQLTLQLEKNAIYMLSLQSNYYDYSASTGAMALYTITVSAGDDTSVEE